VSKLVATTHSSPVGSGIETSAETTGDLQQPFPTPVPFVMAPLQKLAFLEGHGHSRQLYSLNYGFW